MSQIEPDPSAAKDDVAGSKSRTGQRGWLVRTAAKLAMTKLDAQSQTYRQRRQSNASLPDLEDDYVTPPAFHHSSMPSRTISSSSQEAITLKSTSKSCVRDFEPEIPDYLTRPRFTNPADEAEFSGRHQEVDEPWNEGRFIQEAVDEWITWAFCQRDKSAVLAPETAESNHRPGASKWLPSMLGRK